LGSVLQTQRSPLASLPTRRPFERERDSERPPRNPLRAHNPATSFLILLSTTPRDSLATSTPILLSTITTLPLLSFRARVPPLYTHTPPPSQLPPFLPEHAGNSHKEALSRQIRDARRRGSCLVLLFVPRRVKSTVETPVVRGRGERGPPAFPRRRPGLWQPCAEVENAVVVEAVWLLWLVVEAIVVGG